MTDPMSLSGRDMPGHDVPGLDMSGLDVSGLDLPRRNGELAFEAPWQGTVFALAAAVVEHAFGGDREPFRRQLIRAIADEPARPYWESWTAALESLVQALPDSGRATEPG